MARGFDTTCSLAELGLSADRAGIKFSGNGDTRDTLSKVMKIGDTMGMEVTKALMPQNT
jgi:hypothetical protein